MSPYYQDHMRPPGSRGMYPIEGHPLQYLRCRPNTSPETSDTPFKTPCFVRGALKDAFIAFEIVFRLGLIRPANYDRFGGSSRRAGKINSFFVNYAHDG